jgi:hypothetical protein
MLNVRLSMPALLLAVAAIAVPAVAQDFTPHRAVYAIKGIESSKPGTRSSGTYAYELRMTCDSYVVNQRLRLDATGGRESAASEQQTQMTESLDGKRLRFEHRTTTGGRQVSLFKGEATLGDASTGEARFTDPEGQTVALPAGTLFPVAIARETMRQAKAGESGFDTLFFFGEKVKPPQAVNVLIGKVPKRLAGVKLPEGAEALADGRSLIYYRAGFFDAQGKGQGEPAFEMSSITLDNGIELYGTHEESDGGIEYRITRLEALPKPECR